MPTTTLLISIGERLTVEGSTEDVTREIEDAARSTSGTLAWLREAGTGQAIGVNPAHVVTLTPGEA